MDKQHPEVSQKSDGSGPSQAAENTANAEVFKRSSDEICIWSCRTKKQRTALYQSTIPEWTEPKTMMAHNHAKAQKYHRSIFEMMVLDLAPFNVVNKPGFLRNYALLAPNFEVSFINVHKFVLIGHVRECTWAWPI